VITREILTKYIVKAVRQDNGDLYRENKDDSVNQIALKCNSMTIDELTSWYRSLYRGY